MTRINVVPAEELTHKHLMGEYHEITRVYGLARKAAQKYPNKFLFRQKVKQPKEYTMGTGHVLFFYDKIGFISERYKELQFELELRGYNINPIPLVSLEQGIPEWLKGCYTPTQAAKEINQQRINERLKA